ncbi:MAG TPA: penicillin-binding protein 1C [Kiritimatiellia bacterium]|nr:penicillin-binding protein 1C [Kiritimatiellia bacterium]HSA17342.1 penicillin-binding protein 1C [Kiritimatiellia bacterium]
MMGYARWLLRGAAGALAGGGIVAVLNACYPFPRAALDKFPAATVLADREGNPLRLKLGPGDMDNVPLYRWREDDWIAKAVVAAEDQRFYRHVGIDPLALLRAVGQNVLHLRRVSGASTLSTQVIRLVQPRPRTLRTKVIETFRALQLERALTKREILEQYLNRAPFGSNIVGIESAARRYFSKSAHDLNLAEAALLAGLPQAPARFRPDRHPARARKRQAYVLERMAALEMITEDQRARALERPCDIKPGRHAFTAPHFAQFVLDRLPPDRDGTTLRTTLDPSLQSLAETSLARRHGYLDPLGIMGGAVVILEVKTGAVRAMVGSPDYFDAARRGQVNGALAPRGAGSTLKPFVYAAAFDRGLATPLTVLRDEPALYRDYRPENFGRTFRGDITVRDSLILSLNLPVLALAERIGAERLHALFRRAGLKTLGRGTEHYGLGLVLGQGEVRLLDLANAYAAFARGGVWRSWTVWEGQAPGAPRRLFSPDASWLVADILGGDERMEELSGHLADARMPRMAWKTGTSSACRDAWTVAFNPEYVVGVWIGNPGGEADEGLVGVEAAAPVAWDIFRGLYPGGDGPWFVRPDGLKRRVVCAASGCPVGSQCGHGVEDWYIAGASLFAPCPVHGRPVAAPVVSAAGRQHDAPDALRITSPAAGTVYRQLDNWSGERQQIALRAGGGAGSGELHWFADDRYLGQGAELFWPIERGAHQLVCCNAVGQSDRVRIVVE